MSNKWTTNISENNRFSINFIYDALSYNLELTPTINTASPLTVQLGSKEGTQIKYEGVFYLNGPHYVTVTIYLSDTGINITQIPEILIDRHQPAASGIESFINRHITEFLKYTYVNLPSNATFGYILKGNEAGTVEGHVCNTLEACVGTYDFSKARFDLHIPKFMIQLTADNGTQQSNVQTFTATYNQELIKIMIQKGVSIS